VRKKGGRQIWDEEEETEEREGEEEKDRVEVFFSEILGESKAMKVVLTDSLVSVIPDSCYSLQRNPSSLKSRRSNRKDGGLLTNEIESPFPKIEPNGAKPKESRDGVIRIAMVSEEIQAEAETPRIANGLIFQNFSQD
jgi:hypothetical protein